MHVHGTGWSRWVLAGILCLLLGTAGVGSRLWADDVPPAARKDYDNARALFLKGDPKSLTAAFSALSQGKSKAGESVDFWELFVRVWRANKKPEADLWEKLIGPREQAAPGSAAFDLVRFRVETDAAKKREHLEKAVQKDPKAIPPRLLLAKELRAQGEEDKAEELVDKILEEQPGLEEALTAKVDLMLASGLSRVALKFAEEQLARQECPGLRHALAQVQRNLIAEDGEMRAKALANAEKAVAARPDPAFVATLADLLDENDRLADALALLEKHVATTPDERLVRRLGDYAWRAGDYDTAARHLAAAASSDAKAAKGLAFAHARRNRLKEAQAALDQLLALDKEDWPAALELAIEALDAGLIRKHLAGRTFENDALVKAAADSLEAKVGEVKTLVGAKASDGSREGEDYLLMLLEARLHAKLGPKLAPLLKQWRETRAQVVGGKVASAKPLGKPLELEGRSHGFMQRMASYVRSVCGDEMSPGDIGLSVQPPASGEVPDFGWAVEATSDCGRERMRVLRFKVPAQGNQVQLNPHPEVWQAALEAFKEGCAALVAEDYPKAQEAFGKALEQEKGWFRARFYKAVAAALAAGGDLAAASREANEAANALPDDWFARELAVKLTAIAGGDPLPALKELLAHQDARSHGPLSEL